MKDRQPITLYPPGYDVPTPAEERRQYKLMFDKDGNIRDSFEFHVPYRSPQAMWDDMERRRLLLGLPPKAPKPRLKIRRKPTK